MFWLFLCYGQFLNFFTLGELKGEALILFDVIFDCVIYCSYTVYCLKFVVSNGRVFGSG